MAISVSPLFYPPVSSLKISKEPLRSLLEKEVEIQCTTTDKVKLSIKVRVEEVFAKFKTAIDGRYSSDPCFEDVHFAGSSLAAIWSGEESSDIDMHAILNMTGREESRHIADTFNVEWLLLQAVLDAVKPHIPSDLAGKVTRESFFCKKKATLLHTISSSIPYNTYTLSIGSPPIEFSVWCLCSAPEKPARNYDFNSGSLQLRALSDDLYELSSTFADVPTTISFLEKKELQCVSPEQLTRRAVVRYLSKVLVSGYTELDPDLFKKLLAVGTVIDKGSETPLTPDLLLKQIADVFDDSKEGSATYITILLHLWFMQNEDENFAAVKLSAKKELIRVFSLGGHPLHKEMHTLVLNGKKSELAWLLLFMSENLKKINYRGDESLQLILPSHLLSDKGVKRKLYLPLPCKGLLNFKEGIAPRAFVDHEFPSTPIVRCGAGVVSTVSAMGEILFTSPSHFPMLYAHARKFDLKFTALQIDRYQSLFFSWFTSLTKEQKREVPLDLIAHSLSGFKEKMPLSIEDQIDLIEVIYNKLRSSSAVCEWERECLRSDAITAMAAGLIKSSEFIKLEERMQNLLLDIAKTQIYKMFSGTDTSQALYAKDPSQCKKSLALTYQLYEDKRISIGPALRAVDFCIDCNLIEPAIKFLKLFWKAEKGENFSEILPLAYRLAQVNLLEYLKALSESTDLQDRNILRHYVKAAAAAFFEQAHPDIETTKKLLPLINSCFSEEEKLDLARSILLQASKGNSAFDPLFSYVYSEWKLSARHFAPFTEMSSQCLALLAKEKDFSSCIETDSAFASVITSRALELNMDSIAASGLNALAVKDPAACIKLMQIPRFTSTLTPESFMQCVGIWDSMLAKMPQSAKDSIKASLMAQLGHFKRYLEGCTDVALLKKLQPSIQKLHRACSLFTLDSELWPVVWSVIRKHFLDSERTVSAWVKLPEEGSDTVLDMSSKIAPLLSAFVFNAQETLAWTKRLLANTEYPIEEVNERIYNVMLSFAPTDPAILKIPSVEESLVAEQVFARISSSVLSFFSLHERKKICHCVYFCTVFGDASLRSKIIDYMGTIPPLLTYFTAGECMSVVSIQEREIPFICILRAWQSRNFTEVMSFTSNSYIISWIARGNCKGILKEICKEFTGFIHDALNGKISLSEKELNVALAFHFNCLFMQKSRLIHSTADEEERKVVNDIIDGCILACFQSVKKKRNFAYLIAFIGSMESVRPLMQPKEKERLAVMIVDSFIECLQADKKNEPTKEINEYMLAFCQFTPIDIVRDSITFEQKARLLNELIDAYTRYRKLQSSSTNAAARLFNVSTFFQLVITSLSNEEKDAFFIEWIKKIATAARPYSTEECILFSEFMEHNFSVNGYGALVKNKDFIISCLRSQIAIPFSSLSLQEKENLNTFIHQLASSLYLGMQKVKVSVDARKAFNTNMFDICLAYNERYPHSHFFVSLTAALYMGFFGKLLDGRLGIFYGCSEKKLAECLVLLVKKVSLEVDFADDKFVRTIKSVKEIYDSKGPSLLPYLKAADKALLAEFFSLEYFK